MPAETVSPSVARRKNRGQLVAVSCVCLLLAIGVLGYSILFFGYVEGEEFAPDSFARRKFSYHEIPLLAWQISPIDRTDLTNSLESHLTTQNFIADLKTPAPKKRWDLVVARRGITPSKGGVLAQGNARILCEYLDAKDSHDESIWLEWTKQHPELAKVIWPLIAQVARQDLYVFAPDLLHYARNAKDATGLQNELNARLADKYVAFGQIQQQLNHHDEAVELFTEALRMVPSRADALLARAKSLTTLGKNDKASADLAQAERLGERL